MTYIDCRHSEVAILCYYQKNFHIKAIHDKAKTRGPIGIYIIYVYCMSA
jgi:hypothetical protein